MPASVRSPETQRVVGWCRDCCCVHDPYIRGERCPCDGGRVVVKRRMYRCRECSGYYPTRRALAEHEHHDLE